MYCTLPRSAVAKLLLTSANTSVDFKIPGGNSTPSSTAHHYTTT